MMPSKNNLSFSEQLQNTDFLHPEFEKEKLIFSTSGTPGWIHFGANDGCMLPAFLIQNLIEKNETNCGLLLAEARHFSFIDNIIEKLDNNGICLTKKTDSHIEKKVISTVVESLKADISLFPKDWDRLVHVFRNPSLQIVSFSLGSNSYSIYGTGNKLISCYEKDCGNEPDKAHTELGKITALCYERFLAGEYPLAMVSFDDCPKNGSRLNEAVVRIAREWEERGKVFTGFSGWLNEPEIIAFPWTKIKKTNDDELCRSALIDALPEDVIKILENNKPPLLIRDENLKIYIEDDFPNGRLPMEKAGVVFSSRDEIVSIL